MKITLTASQSAQIEPHLATGTVMLGRVDRQRFDGSNAETSGTLQLVFVSIPADRLDDVRRAIAGEVKNRKARA